MNDSLPMIRLLTLLTLFVILAATPGAEAAEGIVIYRDLPSTADAFAKASEFQTGSPFAVVTNFTRPDGAAFSIENGLIIRLVTYPKLDAIPEIMKETDLTPINGIVKELAGYIQKYPVTGKFLQPRLRLFEAEVARFRAGQAKFEGQWFPTHKAVDDLVIARKAEVARQQAAEKQRLENIRLEEEKKRMQDVVILAAAEQERAKKEREIQDAERKVEEARKLAEGQKAAAAQIAAQEQAEQRRQVELRNAEERRERELRTYVAERLKRVDRFRSDLDEPVLAR
jgi:hypothetical protein